MTKNLGIIIPARYKSTRLPGKPLIDLCGKTMIQRTWERCVTALSLEQVYVATESKEIASHVKAFGGNVIVTSASCLTGTDRVAEANAILQFDLVVNVQGDEPIIDPIDIQKVIKYAQENNGTVVNAIAPIDNELEFRSNTVPKVVKTLNNDLLYMSRSPIPGGKSGRFSFGYKQICIYAFPKDSLELIRDHNGKTPFEAVEDIEILRFIELGKRVKLVEVSGKSMAVDIEQDVNKVIHFIKSIEKSKHK